MTRPGILLVAILVIAMGIIGFTSRFYQADPPLAEKEDQADKADKNQQPSGKVLRGEERTKAFDNLSQGAVRTKLEIENVGSMTIELYPQAAPKTVAHIVELINKGFYTGILFHRVEPNFVAQVGDPESKKFKKSDFAGLNSTEAGEKFHLGMTGSGQMVDLEQKLPHLPYTVGLARASDPNSGDSQFYINLKDNANLDDQYCVFGKVVQGQELSEKIALGDKITSFTVIK